MLRQQLGRKCFRQRFLYLLNHRCHHLLNRVRVEETAFHLLRRTVIRLQSHRGKFQIIWFIYIGMRHIDTSVENSWFAKDDIFLAKFILSQDILYALKPHQINDSCAIRKMRCQTALPSFTNSLKTEDFSFQLNIRHIAIYFMNVIDAAPVNIFIREIIN